MPLPRSIAPSSPPALPAPVRFAPVNVATSKFALVRLAWLRIALVKFALRSVALVRFCPARFTPVRLCRQADSAQIVGLVAGRGVSCAGVMPVPHSSHVMKFAPPHSAPVKLAPVSVRYIEVRIREVRPAQVRAGKSWRTGSRIRDIGLAQVRRSASPE